MMDVQENRQSLLVVAREEVTAKMMNKTMKYLIQSTTTVTWPEDNRDKEAFWKKLHVRLMKKSDIYTSQCSSNSNVSIDI